MTSVEQLEEVSKGGWHIAREIPIALVAAVVLQTVGGAMWLASLSNKVDAAIESLREFKVDRYTKEDARNDREYNKLLMQTLQIRDVELERRIQNMEAMLGTSTTPRQRN